MHRRLVQALNTCNEQLHPSDPLRITVGDEFQGHFPTVGAALDASFRVHLALRPEVHTRFGLGWGEVFVLDPDGTQDGPGWWSARDAIEWVKRAAGASATPLARTAYRGSADGPSEPALCAALLCRDHLVGSLDDRSLRILGALMDGRTQAEIAADEGVSASAVSQRFRSDGLGLILAAAEQLRDVR